VGTFITIDGSVVTTAHETEGSGGVTIPIEELRAAGLGPQVERLSAAVASYLDEDKTLDRVDSNVAVVSDPFGGRAALLEYAAELLGDRARRDSISGIADADELPDIEGETALILEGCHYLYRRDIDGFDRLEAFLERLAMTNTLVVTGWNRYSWQYLTAVERVDEAFPLTITLPPLDAEQIEAVVRAHDDDTYPEYVDTGEAGRIKTIDLVSHDVSLPGDRSVSVPYLRPNVSWLVSWAIWDDAESIEAVVFEKLRRLSNGTPGIATSLWEQSVRDGPEGRTIAPAYIDDPVDDCHRISDDAAFLLWLVVAMEGVERAQLADMLDQDAIGTEIQTLANKGIVRVDGSAVELQPLGLHPAVAELRRRGLIWT